ncbi:lytic transglycosylase domain-containing protein [Photobacterium sp. Hal280]|uniref:lytic transglycosylase domain-containing protein n=1 Tax=Photobacterium sp. Hal280 TaxID=3035163 RepID=UPI00301D58E3
MTTARKTAACFWAGFCCWFTLIIMPGFAFANPASSSFSLSANALQAQVDKLLPHRQLIQRHLLRHQETLLDIARALRDKQLPANLALLPMIESTFRVDAVSSANAAGLWQLIPATAERFGLQVQADNDERFDVKKSTQAAVAYLSFLYNKFDQDLALTLAAYNAGEGRVGRAMKKANSHQFTALSLPKETRDYVHKFHALLSVVDLDALTRQASSKDPLLRLSISRPPTDMETRILTDLFAKREVINMSPVKPLIPL